MKQNKMSHCKKALLALASVALLTPGVRGATITPNMGDAILGFRATASGSQGQTANLEVDLGPVSQFYGLTPGQTVSLSALSILDLSATYGANWITRSDLYWGVIATAGRAVAYSNGVVNLPVGTLWASAPNCAAAWNKGSSFAQKNASAAIEATFVAGSPLNGATSTANSGGATVISATAPGSWSAQDLKTAGTSFGYFNPSIDNYEGTNVVVSQLYELQPGSGKGTYLGDLIMNGSGLSFRAASPVSAVCKSGVVLQAGLGCTATVTADDIDGGSTGYCLSLSIDSGGPFSIGSTNLTLIAVDGAGETNTCTTTVTVAAGAPTVPSSANITTNVTSGCTAAVTFATPTATGCATPINVVCTPASGATFSIGSTTVHCVATDAASNTGSNSFTVTVASTAAPAVNCPSDITQSAASGQCSAVVTYTTPTATGCNTPINVVCTPASGATFNVGTNTVTCTATDAASRTGTCSFKVIVTSTAAPTVNCPANITQSVSGTNCSAVVTYTTPTATGCNTPINVVCSPASGSTFSAGATTVTCTATDAASRTGTCSFTVTVNSAAPTVTAPASIVTNLPSGSVTNMVINYTTPTGNGCATPINVVCSPAAGSTFAVGTHTVTCTATDAASRTGTCSFTVTVNGAGISGITQLVNALTDPKMTTPRKNSLLVSLNLANAELNNTNVHIKATTKTLQACGQLNGFLIKVKTYEKLSIISSNEAVSLTAAVNAEKTAIGCTH